MLAGMDAVQDSFDHFLAACDRTDRRAVQELEPSLYRIALLREELAGMANACRNQTLRLPLSVEVSAAQNSRQTLLPALAAALAAQLAKLDSPETYFQTRSRQAYIPAAIKSVEYLDRYLDVNRSNSVLQSALVSFLASIGAQEIAPQRNQEFRGLEHEARHAVDPTSPSDVPRAISRLLIRGLRFQGEVIRKAEVEIFR